MNFRQYLLFLIVGIFYEVVIGYLSFLQMHFHWRAIEKKAEQFRLHKLKKLLYRQRFFFAFLSRMCVGVMWRQDNGAIFQTHLLWVLCLHSVRNIKKANIYIIIHYQKPLLFLDATFFLFRSFHSVSVASSSGKSICAVNVYMNDSIFHQNFFLMLFLFLLKPKNINFYYGKSFFCFLFWAFFASNRDLSESIK